MEKLFGSTLNMEIDLEVAKVLIWSSSTSQTHILPSRTINIIKIVEENAWQVGFFFGLPSIFLFSLSPFFVLNIYQTGGGGKDKNKPNGNTK